MGDDHSVNSHEQTALVQRLFVQHATQLRGFIVALMPDLAHVDDVLQETFLTVTTKADSFDPQSNFLAWACAIARYKMAEVGRRASRQWQPLSAEVLESLATNEPSPEPGDDPRLSLLAACLEELAPQSRRIIELHYQRAHKPSEIARTIGWAPESVYVALSRARVLLRQCVDRKAAAAGGAS